MRILVVGAGPGDPGLLTGQAKEAIRKGSVVLAPVRLAESLRELNPRVHSVDLAAMTDAVGRLDAGVEPVVVASGDVGFYSISETLAARFPGARIRRINGVSSLQYLAAALGVSYENVLTISTHGRSTPVAPACCYQDRVFVLTGGTRGAGKVLEELLEAGLGHVSVSVGENLGMPEQRIRRGTPEQLLEFKIPPLAVLLVENPSPVSSHQRLLDGDLVRGPVPMSKQEIRDLALSALEIGPGDVVYDIGAGTGSVAIGASRRASRQWVYAIEKNPEALTLIRQNREKTGAYNVRVVEGSAPAALQGLPAPDRVFLGGSGRQMPEIMEALIHKNPGVRVVAAAVTLETLQESLELFDRYRMNPQVSSISVARAETVGGYRMMKAQNPVWLVTGEGARDEK